MSGHQMCKTRCLYIPLSPSDEMCCLRPAILVALETEKPQIRVTIQYNRWLSSPSSSLFPFPWTTSAMYMQKDLKKNQLQDYKQAAEVQKKWYMTIKGATKLSREFMLVSHKSYFSLVSSVASWTWWNGLLKYSQRTQHFKGFLEPAPLPCITPGEGEKRGPKRNRKRAQETASKEGEYSKTEMQKSQRGWDEQRNAHREKETRNERAHSPKNFYSELILRSDEIRAQ